MFFLKLVVHCILFFIYCDNSYLIGSELGTHGIGPDSPYIGRPHLCWARLIKLFNKRIGCGSDLTFQVTTSPKRTQRKHVLLPPLVIWQFTFISFVTEIC